jgi:hypothetical protein
LLEFLLELVGIYYPSKIIRLAIHKLSLIMSVTSPTSQAIYAHQIARARAEASGVRAGVFSILKEA